MANRLTPAQAEMEGKTMSEEKSVLQKKIESANIPNWVKEYARSLEREREQAIKALNKYCDEQTPAPFSIEDNVSTGEQRGPSTKTRFIQTHQIEIKWHGVLLRVVAFRPGKIELQWASDPSGHDIALIPSGYNCADLVAKENMR